MTAFGFGRQDTKQKEPDQLERTLGTEFLPEDSEHFPHFKGRMVEVFLGGSAVFGVYRGTTRKGDAILFPHVVKEILPYTDDRGRNYNNFRLETKDPSHIRDSAIVGMRTADPKYVNTLLMSEKPQIIVAS